MEKEMIFFYCLLLKPAGLERRIEIVIFFYIITKVMSGLLSLKLHSINCHLFCNFFFFTLLLLLFS